MTLWPSFASANIDIFKLRSRCFRFVKLYGAILSDVIRWISSDSLPIDRNPIAWAQLHHGSTTPSLCKSASSEFVFPRIFFYLFLSFFPCAITYAQLAKSAKKDNADSKFKPKACTELRSCNGSVGEFASPLSYKGVAPHSLYSLGIFLIWFMAGTQLH